MVSTRIDPAELAALLASRARFALIDVRDESAFSRGHLFRACSVPARRLEIGIPARVPHHDIALVLCDDEGGALADDAAVRLRDFGYSDVRVLGGGIAGWRATGLATYSGMHTPSKAFGELVEARFSTPAMTADSLRSLQSQGAPVRVIDCRPHAEYLNGSLPGSINLPGVELPYRLAELDAVAGQRLVVHCAGRTRSIIAAQSLREWTGHMDVHALENGTMGWLLAGHELVQPRTAEKLPDLVPARRSAQRELARGRRAAGGIPDEDLASVRAAWAARRDEATMIVDVRSRREYLAGHFPGAIHAPGGQLLQATDSYLLVNNARVIVCDDDGFRATVAATWLRRMGWRTVSVWAMDEGATPLESGPEREPVLMPQGARATLIDAEVLASRLMVGPVVLFDLDSSLGFERGHLPGSRFVRRDRLAAVLADTGEGACDDTPVLVCPDGRLAQVAAADLAVARPGRAPLSVFAGGKRAWQASGRSLETGASEGSRTADDVWRRPIEAGGDPVTNMKAYLSWETGLIHQMQGDPSVRFDI